MSAEFKNEVFKIQQALSVESIRIEKNFIVVTIPFNRINVTPFELDGGEPAINPTLKPTIKLTKAQNVILEEISKNPNVTQAELASILKYQRSLVSESMSKLQALGILKRVGSKKTGHWEIVKEDY